ncbi:hypothetical protein MDOR_10130 [Mycolicibacterium doricum]|uniref:Uncharacterized protein n=2 Tax=Mycolicibacterium doricum TaxID=126673 RepID=A0A7I7VNJ8_9MYCO|nr:hypothetical protein MDOR_10130 [Mycolicibacterium doricum]
MTLKNKGLQFKATVVQWGPVPPAGGPSRVRYLDVNGRRALQVADDKFAAVMQMLDAQRGSVPVMHMPLMEDDDDARLRIQSRLRAQWDEFTTTLSPDLLQEIEPRIRKSEKSAVAALNFLEDHNLSETAHEAIHRAAFVRRGLFGCPITFRDGDFWTSCSIRMSHIRIGMSAGLTSEFECSVCDRLVDECDHTTGLTYDKVAERDSAGDCTVCKSKDCEHRIGSTYPILAYGNARNVMAHEVSMVARPRYPQARFTELTLDLSNSRRYEILKWGAEQGYLHCDGCLGPCKGFSGMADAEP